MTRVLIVDDDADLLEMVCFMVSSSGMDPVCVSSGDAVMAELEKRRFGLILMDIYLGDHDGREIARQLKESDQYKNIPILLYSAGSVTQNSIEASRADGFLQKPFEMRVLIQRMKDLAAG